MKIDLSRNGKASSPGAVPAAVAVAVEPGVPRRAIIKALLAVAGAAGAGHLVADPPRVEAVYTEGTPSDTVNTNLTVEGNLVANQGVGVGRAAPGTGELDVAGAIRINGTEVIGTDGVIKQSYYAP